MKAYKEQFMINLNALKQELMQYENQQDIWKIIGNTKNTPANLALHICGNLKHNFGAEIGANGYVRNRDEEFARRGLTREEVIDEIDSTIEMIEPIIDKLTFADVTKPFPSDIHGEGQTIGSVITKIALHLGYHLGQINYHRRIISSIK